MSWLDAQYIPREPITLATCDGCAALVAHRETTMLDSHRVCGDCAALMRAADLIETGAAPFALAVWYGSVHPDLI